jgi:hypothetical protein
MRGAATNTIIRILPEFSFPTAHVSINSFVIGASSIAMKRVMVAGGSRRCFRAHGLRDRSHVSRTRLPFPMIWKTYTVYQYCMHTERDFLISLFPFLDSLHFALALSMDFATDTLLPCHGETSQGIRNGSCCWKQYWLHVGPRAVHQRLDPKTADIALIIGIVRC